MPDPHQAWLFPYPNPLVTRLDPDFFKELPTTPGVYLMLGEDGRILYVGKAKNLRSRVRSYRLAKPGRVSRKVMRLVHLIREIRWETCESETVALLRENQLLREHQPPFNVVNTRPENYSFVGLRFFNGQMRLRITRDPKRQGDLLYGAFKSRRGTIASCQALLRLLWICQRRGPSRFELPPALTRDELPSPCTVALENGLKLWVRRLFKGTSDELLKILSERILANDAIPRFAYQLVQEDLDRLKDFFDRVTAGNRRMRIRHGIRGRLIPQERLDDLLVLEKSRDSGA